LLKRSILNISIKEVIPSYIKAFTFSFISGFIVVYFIKYLGNYPLIGKYIDTSSRITQIIYLGIAGPLFVIFYLALMKLFKSPEVGELFAILRKKKA
jgi:hypothetical protein